MSIPVTCQCGKSFQAKPELAGKRLSCPACGSALQIPNPQADSGIVVRCGCGQGFRAKAELAGKNVKCPACGSVLPIPASQAAATSGFDLATTNSYPQGDPLGAGDPFGGNLFCDSNYSAVPQVPSSNYSQPAYGVQSGSTKSRAGLNPRMVKGLVIGGASLAGIALVVLVGVLVYPLLQPGRLTEAQKKSIYISIGHIDIFALAQESYAVQHERKGNAKHAQKLREEAQRIRQQGREDLAKANNLTLTQLDAIKAEGRKKNWPQ